MLSVGACGELACIHLRKGLTYLEVGERDDVEQSDEPLGALNPN